MEHSFARSKDDLERAANVIPGGVNSPVRAFKGVGGVPRFISSANGAFVTDVDGNEYLDYVGSWGPMILGHNAESTKLAIADALERGTSFGAPTVAEIELAELLAEIVPGMEMLRMVSSGTEATMSALRLARGYTGRDIIIKCDGCYHGHADSLLVSAGSGVATFGIPGSPGVPEEIAKLTLTVPYNDLDAFSETLSKVGADKVAALIVEPVPGNMGLVLPEPGYLAGLREICSMHGIVLIFDEVMSGFRVALGGASQRFNVTPDMTTLGKVIGGGLPVGAFGGKKDIMQQLAPVGPVYQAGTLSGNPLATAAGLSTLRELKRLNPYPALEELGERWRQGMLGVAQDLGINMTANCCGSMIGFYFSDVPVVNFELAKQSNTELFAKFFHGMLEKGVYLAPSAFEAGFLSTEHTAELIDQTIAKAREVLSDLA